MQISGWARMAVLALLLLPAACIPRGYDAEGYDRPAPQYPYPDRYASPQRYPHDYERQSAEVTPAPPSAAPAWVATPVTPDARTIGSSTYVVHPGDTLRSIANTTGAGSEAIARANAISPPFTIHAGETLRIPGGRYHLVRAGQTGIAIARAYGVPWSQIIAANALTDPYILRVGMRVLIPGNGTPSLAERAAAFQIDVGDIVTGGEPTPQDDQRPARPITTPTRVLSPTIPIETPTRLHGNFIWPVNGRVVARFGPGASGEKNNGIKIAVPLDTPIRASADGVVAYSGNEIAVLGGLVIVRHGDGWSTVYGHTSRILVQRGQSVKRGQIIAYSGDSGLADRPELHFEMRKGRNPVDPMTELPSL